MDEAVMMSETVTNEPGILQVVAMGVFVVFVVLIFLIGIIKLMGLVMAKLSEKQTAAPAAGAAAAAAPTTPSDKQKLVAAIASAIAEDMGTDVSHLKIHSIRKL